MRPSADDDDAEERVDTSGACDLMGIHRTTLWRWIAAGLKFEREQQHPYRYFYRVGDLREMKLERTAARIAVPKRDPDVYDYG